MNNCSKEILIILEHNFNGKERKYNAIDSGTRVQ